MTAIRTPARPRLRAFRRTVLSVLGMTAIIVGLLAMHSSGAEHATVAELSAVTAHPAHADHAVAADHAAAPTAVAVAVATALTATVTVTVTGAAASVPLCDEACMHGIRDCAVLFMTCAMLLVVAALIVVAHRPGEYRKLLGARAQVVSMPPVAPLHVHRPDLTVLSIDRT